METNNGAALPSIDSKRSAANCHPKSLLTSENEKARIFDIRRRDQSASLTHDIKTGLQTQQDGVKQLPTLLLYDERGLKLFEDITYLDEYYLTVEEIELLENHADKIAREISDGTILLELGSGNLRKVNLLLSALERQEKKVEYYALDVNLAELRRTLIAAPTHSYVKCSGLLGTYDDGLEWLKTPQVSGKAKVVMSLGSSIGNFSRRDAAMFVNDMADAAGEHGAVLLGIDACQDPSRIYSAYNDRDGVTRDFTLNGLQHANTLLGRQEFDVPAWRAIGHYNQERGCHQAFVCPAFDTTVLGVKIAAGEKVRIEESFKYPGRDLTRLWKRAQVKEILNWSNMRGDYSMHLITKKKYSLPWLPQEYAPTPVPTWAEWQHLWLLWDTVTRQMIPDEQLLEKPIKLRNACIFYLGHIPTFFDIKLTATTDGIATDPEYYHRIFERGIDPDVENPEQCHAHSELPDQWPPLSDILTYQRRVRERVKGLYDRAADADPKVGRCIWLGYEHEAMHLETLLYMLIQSEKTLPPTGIPIPVWSVQADQAEKSAVTNEWVSIPTRQLTLNLDDPENGSTFRRYFGWDVEKPSHQVQVHRFLAKARPISNGEYAQYLLQTGREQIPASWAEHRPGTPLQNNNAELLQRDGSTSPMIGTKPSLPANFLANKYVRTVFGAVPLSEALTWPVSASYDELAKCATYMGGRIPSLEETRSIYAYADEVATQSSQTSEERLGRTIPAVNGHLVNDGVEESPPHSSPSDSMVAQQSRLELFTNLKGCNVGFQHWHPTPVTDKGNKLCGQGDTGGVWEWTSTPLSKQPGFEPMPLYEAYSQDFFDGKHNIVLGGSWATVPRIAGRKTFVNWYQRNYLYVWAGARIVRDA